MQLIWFKLIWRAWGNQQSGVAMIITKLDIAE